jgi:hypothetical protein
VKHGEGKSCLISESSLKLLGELGDGAFGVVTRGEWTPNKGSKVIQLADAMASGGLVVVKTLPV